MDSTTRTIYILGAIVLLLFAGVLLLHSPARTTIVEANTTVPEAILAQEVPEVPQEEEPAPPSTVAPERVVIETSKGIIEVELDRENAPITVENFVTYVNEGFYNGTIFHRVINGFMIQGGGFTSEGLPKETHSPIILESNNGLKNTRGTIAMARTMDSNSATSQFFINVEDNSLLDYGPGNPGYAVFGKVTSGMDVVDQIKEVETTSKYGASDWPTQDVLILRVYLKE